eukprot:TRINITY_DN6431_c0_g3_i1.p1 TRINITY_DN6431_c0_g3~~TRINITY_DN6431_c0_g3_i1.p1  ORF type:complete len:167 (-),score=10.65 TRINITY_DN6431_c0_g3_i1:287-787(-)
MISTSMFIMFKVPSKQLLYLDKKCSKTENEPRYTILHFKRTGLFIMYKWNYIDKHCHHCNLIDYTVDECPYNKVVFSKEIKTITHVNPDRESSAPQQRFRVHRKYTGSNWTDFSDFVEGEENELELFEDSGPNNATAGEFCLASHTQILTMYQNQLKKDSASQKKK